MESQREGADPLSPKPRYKVLRAGIRYVGEQFPPYDETPWEEDSDLPLWASICLTTMRKFGKQLTQISWIDEAADPLTDLEKAMKKVADQMNEATPLAPVPGLSKLESNVRKYEGKQQLPFYVQNERRRRR